jgi:DNA repair protein RadC
MDNINKISASIKNWSEDERPREKMAAKGPAALTDSELIAILINNGTKNKTAVDLARELLQESQNNLIELGKISLKQLQKVKGIGQAKAITISAALELGRRFTSAAFLQKPVVKNVTDLANYVQTQLRDYNHEVVGLVCLNTAALVTNFSIISQGGLNTSIIDTKIVFKKALEHNAAAIAICHNHPSGNLQPSQSDITVTKQIQAAAATLQIKFIDHIIVSEQGYYSFANQEQL